MALCNWLHNVGFISSINIFLEINHWKDIGKSFTAQIKNSILNVDKYVGLNFASIKPNYKLLPWVYIDQNIKQNIDLWINIVLHKDFLTNPEV